MGKATQTIRVVSVTRSARSARGAPGSKIKSGGRPAGNRSRCPTCGKFRGRSK